MKKVDIYSDRGSIIVTLYFDTDVFSLLVPPLSAEESDQLIKTLCLSYFAHNQHQLESQYIYITRVINDDVKGMYTLLCTNDTHAFSRLTISSDDNAYRPINMPVTTVPDGHRSGIIAEKFGHTKAHEYTHGLTAQLNALKIPVLQQIKALPNPMLPRVPNQPTAPIKIDQANANSNLDEINRRFAHVTRGTTVQAILNNTDRVNTSGPTDTHITTHQRMINQALADIQEPVETALAKCHLILTNQDNSLSASDVAELVEHANPQLEPFKQSYTQQVQSLGIIKINLVEDLVRSHEELIQKLHAKLHQYNYGNDVAQLAFIKQLLIYSLYQAAVEYYKVIWNEIRSGTDAVKKKNEFNQKFAGIASINDSLQLTSFERCQGLLTSNLSGLQTFTVDLLKRCDSSRAKSSRATTAVLNSLNLVKGTATPIPFTVSGKTGFCFTNDSVVTEQKADQFLDDTPTEFAIFKPNIDKNTEARRLIDRADQEIEAIDHTAKQIQIVEKNIAAYKQALLIRKNFLAILEANDASRKQLLKLASETSAINQTNEGQPGFSAEIQAEISEKLNGIQTNIQNLVELNNANEERLAIINTQFNGLVETLRLHTNDDASLRFLAQATAEAESVHAVTKQHIEKLNFLIAQISVVKNLMGIQDRCNKTAEDAQKDYSQTYQLTDEIQFSTMTAANDFYSSKIAKLNAAIETITNNVNTIDNSLPKFKQLIQSNADDKSRSLRDCIAVVEQNRKNHLTLITCQIIINAILNFAYWNKQAKIFNRISVYENGTRHYIPNALKPLVDIAIDPAYQGWTTDANTAQRLLGAVATHANSITSTNNNPVGNLYTSLKSNNGVLCNANARTIDAIQHLNFIKGTQAKFKPKTNTDMNSVTFEKPKTESFFKRNRKILAGIGIGALVAGAVVASIIIPGAFPLIVGGIATGFALIPSLSAAAAGVMSVVTAGVVSGAAAVAAGVVGYEATVKIIEFVQKRRLKAAVAEIPKPPAPPAEIPPVTHTATTVAQALARSATADVADLGEIARQLDEVTETLDALERQSDLANSGLEAHQPAPIVQPEEPGTASANLRRSK